MKQLKFIHITKCAGSTIEEIGRDNKVWWGKYNREYGWWHGIFSRKDKNLKDKYDWFMVVRNPYDRIISEYYCKWGSKGKEENNSVEYFNKFLINKIKNRPDRGGHYTEQYKYLDGQINYKSIQMNILRLINKPYLSKYYKLKPKNIYDIKKMITITKKYLEGNIKFYDK